MHITLPYAFGRWIKCNIGASKYKLFLGQVIPNIKATNEDTGGQANKWANR